MIFFLKFSQPIKEDDFDAELFEEIDKDLTSLRSKSTNVIRAMAVNSDSDSKVSRYLSTIHKTFFQAFERAILYFKLKLF